LEQYERLNGKEEKEVFVNRGYRGIKEYKATKIYVPKPIKIVHNSNEINIVEELQ
jgi:hypothetical protein